jgi:hypothetical protein
MTRNVRERLGAALSNSDLTWARDGEERGVDRIVASAWTGERLGMLLARLKYARERTTFNLRTAMWMIVAKCERRGRYGKERFDDALVGHCAAALDEWMNDECPSCFARGYVRLEATPKACGRCAGSGRLQWTDEERGERLAGITYDRKKYERVIQRLQEADGRHHNETRKGLNDGT